MGVLNFTPDSFSDGGRYPDARAAVDAGLAMLAAGADLLDVGGESTRPGALPVPADEQVRRVVPVIDGLTRAVDAVVSVDTTSAAVAAAAVDAGAAAVNDVTAGTADPGMFPLVAARGVAVVLMHMRGTPATMQVDPQYGDVVGEVCDHLRARTASAMSAGVPIERVLVDPGIGFGKTVDHNLALLRRTDALVALGRPVVVGTSRKGFIGHVTGVTDPARRQFGTAATVAWAVANGAAVVRVHDVGEMVQVVRMTRAIRGARSQEAEEGLLAPGSWPNGRNLRLGL